MYDESLVETSKKALWPGHREGLDSGVEGSVARLLLCFHQSEMVVLHGFIKKTRRTPADDLELARRRMKEVIV